MKNWEKYLFLFIIAFFLSNWPILSIAAEIGIIAVYYYIIILMIIIILSIFLILFSEKHHAPKDSNDV